MAKIHRVRPPETIPQSSLADIAFLLLVFFIATTTIGEEFGLPLILPQKSKGAQNIQVSRENVTVISTDPTGRVFYVDDEPTELRQIREVVRTR